MRYFERRISDYFDRFLSNLNKINQTIHLHIDQSLVWHYSDNSIKLPNLLKIKLIFYSKESSTIKKFLSECMPDQLEVFVFRFNPVSPHTTDILPYMASLCKCLSGVTQQVYFYSVDFNSSHTLSKIVKASHNAESVIIRRGKVLTDDEWDFWNDNNYKTKTLSFSTGDVSSICEWKNHSKRWINIVKGISNCGLKNALQIVGINPGDISKKDAQKVLTEYGCQDICIKETYEVQM